MLYGGSRRGGKRLAMGKLANDALDAGKTVITIDGIRGAETAKDITPKKSDAEKLVDDMVVFGTAASIDGKHIDLADVVLPATGPNPYEAVKRGRGRPSKGYDKKARDRERIAAKRAAAKDAK